MAQWMEIGARVALVIGAVPLNAKGAVYPAGTVGTIVGFVKGLPQVDLGDHQPKIVPPHYLKPLDALEGVLVPFDGDTLYSWDVHAALMRRAREGAQG